MGKQDLDDPNVEVFAQDIGTLDLGYGAVPSDYGNISYSGGIDTITLDPSWNSMTTSITLPSTYTIGASGSNYYNNNYAYTNTAISPGSVNITGTGIDMAAGTDISIDGKSLKTFMHKMEERLAILVPDPAKLEQFAALKKAYQHYKLMESLCQEQPKEEE